MPVTIGIGAGDEAGQIIEDLSSIQDISVEIYSKPGVLAGFNGKIRVNESGEPEKALIQDLFASRIQAAVRGTLPANTTLSYLKAVAGVDHLERVALLETPKGDRFLLAPVGVDEGWTASDQIRLLEKARILAPRLGLSDRAAVLSGGRYGDVGRSDRVDRSLALAELVARVTGSEHREILIEDVVPGFGVVIAPDGISGNLIFRTLVFLGGGRAHGAPVVNIDRVFIDTSRASREFCSAIRLAWALARP
jgi:putative methanogen marker protein 4